MSFDLMKKRLSITGENAHKQMIREKLDSFNIAVKRSYQAASLIEWSSKEVFVFKGLMNPVVLTEDYDTKMLSIDFASGFRVGTYFSWLETGTKWIVFTQDLTEMAYFRADCRRCNYKVQWVDKNQRLLETYMSVIGPTIHQIRTSSSMQAKIAQDFPNANLKILIQDNPENQKFFQRYQTFLINGDTYIVEQVDRLSMPGVIQLQATEHYTNLIEDDVEENIRNAWNVLPVLPEHSTDYAIEGPERTKPSLTVEFSTYLNGGRWFIVENEGLSPTAPQNPAKIIESDIHQKTIHIEWRSMKSGLYTVGYESVEGKIYQKAVFVESLF